MVAERGFEHIDQVDAFLVSWAEETLGGAEVTLGPPGVEATATVNFHLLEVRPRQPARGPTPAPLKLLLRYLVSAWSKPLATAHRQLGSLAFAVLQDERLEFDPLMPIGLWRDIGVTPRAAFILCTELVRPRQSPSVPLVEWPLEVVDAALRTVSGRVIAASGQPVPGVAIEAPSSGRRVLTSNDGRFELRHTESRDRPTRLNFVAKGRTCTIILQGRESSEVPLDFESFSLLFAYQYRD